MRMMYVYILQEMDDCMRKAYMSQEQTGVKHNHLEVLKMEISHWKNSGVQVNA